MVVQSFADVSSPSIVPTDVSSVTVTRRPTRAGHAFRTRPVAPTQAGEWRESAG
ncbi:hypothetical protein [Haloarcula sp. 1CSR25-25]|uniref:hypothetical protein n=1 Tax=Haloarcula sp. 1CSR25-25 TaxID=2862545 RepID=UPI0028960C1A|nr:hypothetical protein [Haloarcula sp. 1CSR25-25]MDT3434568.1 hypothetical protein [Haloarcula sp. 1CSR25-25]